MDSVAPVVEVSVCAFCICLFISSIYISLNICYIFCFIGIKVVPITMRGTCMAHSGRTRMTPA